MNNNFILNYELFSELCYKILEKIQSNGKGYDGILCPLKGGFYLSYFMSKHLNLPIKFIEISSYIKKERRDFNIGHRPELNESIFLLCDDIYDSGKTVNKIHSMYPHVEFNTVCLISKIVDADIYFGKYIESNVWVDFFWEIM